MRRAFDRLTMAYRTQSDWREPASVAWWRLFIAVLILVIVALLVKGH